MNTFNKDRLNEIIELEVMSESDLLNELIKDFNASIPRYFNDFQIALSKKDFVLLHRTAHSLKSSSLLLGFELASDLAKKIEYDAKKELIMTQDIELLECRLVEALHELEVFNQARRRIS